MKKIVSVIVLFSAGLAWAEPNFKNTPFDPKTWKKTIKNTPLDPKTWVKTADELLNFDSVEFCEKQASYFAETVKSERPLTHAEKFYLRPWFGDLVDKVTLAQGVDVNNFRGVASFGESYGAGAKTFGYRIYFGETLNRGLTFNLSRIAHELVHSFQFEQLGGTIRNFCRAYTDEAIKNEGVYDQISLEVAALEFQLDFLKWIAANYPNPGSRTVRSKPLSPGHQRTTMIPEYFRVFDPEFAVTSIVNDTKYTVSFDITWEGQPSQKFQLAPGRHHTFWYGYPGGSRVSPALSASLDVDLSNATRVETYPLERYTSTTQSFAESKQYFIAESFGELQIVDSQRRAIAGGGARLAVGSLWTYAQGYLEKEGDTLWVHYVGGKPEATYQEIGYAGGVVELLDSATRQTVEISATEMFAVAFNTRVVLRSGLLVPAHPIGRTWTYDTGQFVKTGEKQWAEAYSKGGSNAFEELDFNSSYVKLIDHSRNVTVVLSAENMFISLPTENVLFKKGRWN